MNKKFIRLSIIDAVTSIAGMAVALCWSAGRLDWWPAWAAIAVWLVWFTSMILVMIRFQPDLMAERISPPQGAKSWDRALLTTLRLTQLARYILTGLDVRNGWTHGISLAAQITGIGLCLLCTALFVWAMASNSFFSAIVRIQSERGHAVAVNGPYRFIRHPGYAAMFVFELAISTLLGSWWAILAGGVCAVLMVIRTALEDRTLRNELDGYAEYAGRVRYRLLPGVW